MYEILTPDFRHEDERGSLVQLVHDGWRQVNVISSKSGTVRGGHYHKVNREAFYVVCGSCEVTLSFAGKEQTRVFRQGDFFAIEPDTGHTFRYLEDTMLIGLYDKGVQISGGGYIRHLQKRTVKTFIPSNSAEGRDQAC